MQNRTGLANFEKWEKEYATVGVAKPRFLRNAIY